MPDIVARGRAKDIFEKLDDVNLDTFVGAIQDLSIPLPYLRLAPDAQTLGDRFRHELQEKVRDQTNGNLMINHLGKYKTLMFSLAEIFHLIDVVDGAPQGPVSLSAGTMAYRWSELLESHARRAYALINGGKKSVAGILAAHIAKNSLQSPFRSGDVLKKGWAELTHLPDIEQSLETLTEIGWLVREVIERPVGRGGKEKVQYWIHPAAISPTAPLRSLKAASISDIARRIAAATPTMEDPASAATAAIASATTEPESTPDEVLEEWAASLADESDDWPIEEEL